MNKQFPFAYTGIPDVGELIRFHVNRSGRWFAVPDPAHVPGLRSHRRLTVLSLQLKVTHYYHSGFSVEYGDVLLIFDYWRGEHQELQPDREITPEMLAGYSKVFVMISHEHVDHFDPVVYDWRDITDVTYIVSYDMPVGTRGKRMSPGEKYVMTPDITLYAYGSTDLGVSYLVDIDGFRIFHAGDLNFWHWRDESTASEIEEAEEEYIREIEPLKTAGIDVAMFPVDPRQGTMYEAGANYFILTVKPRLMIPMHYFHRTDIAQEYSRQNRTRATEILAMPGFGDMICLTLDDEGYTNVRLIRENGVDLVREETAEQQIPDETDPLDINNPFGDSDLPVSLNEEPEMYVAGAGEPENGSPEPEGTEAEKDEL